MRGWLGVVLALASGVLQGCQTPTVMRDGVAIPAGAAIEADLRAARASLGEGEPERARERLEALIEEVPSGPRIDEALFLLGETYMTLEEPEQAIWTYRRIKPRDPWAAMAHLRMAELYRSTDRPELARRVLARAPFDRADASVRVRLYRMLGELTRDAGQDREAVRWFAYERRDLVEGNAIARVEREIDALQARLSARELEWLLGEIPSGPVRDRLVLGLSERAVDEGDPKAAERWLGRLPSRLRPIEEERRRALLQELGRDLVGPGAPIGVVLPLSGPYAPYGRSVLRGIVLGLGTYEDRGSSFRLHVRDTAGDPDRAARATEELIDAGAVAVLGPLRSVTIAAAAPVAQKGGVPLLALAQREDLPFLGAWVFRLGVTRTDQVRVLVRYAMERQGIRRFAILYPTDDYGTSYKNLFWDEVERGGGEIVSVEGYAPDAVDVQTPVRKLVGLHYLTDDERALIEERDRLRRRPAEHEERLGSSDLVNLPPYVDFEALFIPEAAQRVGVILPQVRFYDIRDVLFLGPSGWNDRTLVEIAGADAEGAVFSDVFFPDSDFPFVQEFVSNYYAEHGEEPDALAAEGYDAASILREVLSDGVSASRMRLRNALLRVRDFPGVSGVTSFDEVGGTRKTLYLLTVRRGEIAELRDSP